MPDNMAAIDNAYGQKNYSTMKLSETWDESFSAYALYRHADGREDLKILAANRTFARLIGADYETLPGRLFTDACPMAMDWLPFYIQVAKTRKGNLHESYNQDLKKYLCALVFSPQPEEVAILVIDRTHLWLNDQALRARNKELAAIFASMTTGVCTGRIVRDEHGTAVDLLYEMVNASFEILEGFPTSILTGKRLSEIRGDDPYFKIYADIADHKKKCSFIKHMTLSGFILEMTCFSQDDDTIVFIENDETEKIKAVENLEQAYKTIAKQNATILSNIHYASKIQKNLLPHERLFQEAFADYSILWQPRDIVGGDIYWLKNFASGPPNPEHRFYIASDGIYDQIGENRRPFGYRTVEEIIRKYHGEHPAAAAFETHHGQQPRRDDVQLISFQATGIMCDG